MHACHLVVLKQPPIFSLSKIAICNRVKNKSGKIIWTPLGWGVLRSSSWFSPLSCLSRQWADNKTNFIFLYGIGKESQRKKIRDFFLLFFENRIFALLTYSQGTRDVGMRRRAWRQTTVVVWRATLAKGKKENIFLWWRRQKRHFSDATTESLRLF